MGVYARLDSTRGVERFIRAHERGVEPLEVRVIVFGVRVAETPLAPGVLERFAVPLAREIHPLRVAKLVAHEGEPRLAAHAEGE